SQGAFAFVVKPDSTVELRTIQPGIADGNMIAIDQGLQAGEQVVTDGQDKLQDKSKVTVTGGGGAQGGQSGGRGKRAGGQGQEQNGPQQNGQQQNGQQPTQPNQVSPTQRQQNRQPNQQNQQPGQHRRRGTE